MRKKEKADIHSYLTTWDKLNRYYLYYTELSKHQYKSAKDSFPIVDDARKAFYFRAILYLCHFLKKSEHLYLGLLINSITNDEERASLEGNIKFLVEHEATTNLFNLRDKWIAHRDNDWFAHSQDFPDDTFELYLKLIKSILEKGLGCDIVPLYSRKFDQSKPLLSEMVTWLSTK